MTSLNCPSVARNRESMNARHRATLACLSCRSLHARCGGQIPMCNRCKEEERVCRYPKSRRRRTLEHSLPSPASDILESRASKTPYVVRLETAEPCAAVPLSTSRTEPPSSPFNGTSNTITTNEFYQIIHESGAHELIDSYYHLFHQAHPFAPEKAYVQSRIRSDDAPIMPLYAAMCYVGSLHHQLPQRRDLEQLALRHLRPDRFSLCEASSKGPYRVAALLLLAIASYGQAELGKASDLLERAISLSVSIGMNRVDLLESLPDKELGELWNRTYWYLYIVESALAGTEGEFRFEPTSTFPLPCENDASQQITLAQFDTVDFEDDFHVFSSLTYLIALVRIGRSIKRLCERSKDHPARTVVWADALLMNWKLHLPSDKQQVFTENGETDDIMFQAHLLFHSLCIHVHTSLTAKAGGSNGLLRRRRKLEAAEGAVSLLTVHPCLVQMSPLNIAPLSGIAMSNICASFVIEPELQTRDNLRLILGVFKQLGETWKAAKQEAQTLKAMARLSYSEPSNPPQEILVSPQIGPKDALDGVTSCLFPDIISPIQDSDLGSASPDARDSSLTMPFSENIAGSSTDAYVFSWDF